VKLHAPDGSYTTPLSPVYDFVAGPIRLDRTGNIMATYSRDDTCHQIPPCPAENWIDVTGRGKLVPPETPSYSPDFLPEADCNGEAIDDHGAVYGRCYRARSPHYRWVTGNDPTAFPSGTDNLGDVWIHEVNRYGELVGRTSAGPVYWSANTGRIQIPPAPGVGRLDPVSINDHGVVLLSSDYTEGVTKAASTIAYWTRTGGMKILPRKAWPSVQVHDINNRGTIVGCVGGEGKRQLVPAYWQIQ
jgi:hypothetical protein